jgi:hypothetical protein
MRQHRFVFEMVLLSILGAALLVVFILTSSLPGPVAEFDHTQAFLLVGGGAPLGVIAGFVWARYIWSKCASSGSYRRKFSLGRHFLLIIMVVSLGQIVLRFLPIELVLAMGVGVGAFGASLVIGAQLFERRAGSRIWVALPYQGSRQWIEYRTEKSGANRREV